MKHFIRSTMRLFLFPSLLISLTISAQDNSNYEKAKSEMQEMFGTLPSWMAAYPKHAMPEAWENYKKLSGPESNIPAKYQEMIQLTVASQIPCVYCVYFHRISAKANGATDEEIKEAIALGAQARHWSMVLQSTGMSFDDFKAEFDAMMKYMEEKAKK